MITAIIILKTGLNFEQTFEKREKNKGKENMSFIQLLSTSLDNGVARDELDPGVERIGFPRIGIRWRDCESFRSQGEDNDGHFVRGAV